MESGRGFDGSSEMIDLLESSQNSIWVHPSSPPFHDAMVNFDNQERSQGRRATAKREHTGGDDTGGEEFNTTPYHQTEKKRRLTQQQVEFLEKSFEVENKLEPERKVKLAKEVGLQPRQVAIWFQNRRARYKTKQLEKDYDSLKASYDCLKLDYESLSKENHDLQIEIKTLTKKLKQRDEGKDYINSKLHHHMDNPMPKWGTQMSEKMAVPNKQLPEEENSAKSDVVDSDSPHCNDGNQPHSPLADPTDQQSDFSQGEEEHLMLSKRLLLPATPPPSLLPCNNMIKVEGGGGGCYDDPNASSWNFSLIDDHPFLSWLC